MIKEEAIKILSDMRAEYNIFSDDEEEATRYHALSWAIRALNERTGRWIDGKVKHIKNGELRNVRECSECGSSYFVYDYYNSVDEIPKFCPNCGAKMEVENVTST